MLTGAFKARGHQHFVCSFDLAGSDRVTILGDMVVIHATAVVAEVTQCLLNFRTASVLLQQISERIYLFADTLGIVAKSMALGLTPFGSGHFIEPKSGISSKLEILCGMPKTEHFHIGVEAFGERRFVLCTICVTTSFSSGFWSLNGTLPGVVLVWQT